MRSTLSFGLPLLAGALASAPADQSWSYEPDKTAEWYQQHGLELPEVAPEITTVEQGKSYVVKLDCIECPFRVREKFELVETWQEDPQDSSLLLNFTVSNDPLGIYLDDDDIALLPPRPPALTAFQIPANTSTETMGKMVDQHMMNHEAWNLGTKYGRFELQYEHALVDAKKRGEYYLQFDIQGIHMRQSHNPGSYKLDKEGQKMVQLFVKQDLSQDTLELSIKDIQVIERKDRQQPIKMDCGKLAMISTQYNPLEWDFYGKFGTIERAWHRVAWGIVHRVERHALFYILAVVIGTVSLVRSIKQRRERQIIAVPGEDAEAALPASEGEDSPPEYSDVPDFKLEGRKGEE